MLGKHAYDSKPDGTLIKIFHKFWIWLYSKDCLKLWIQKLVGSVKEQKVQKFLYQIANNKQPM